MQRLLGLISNVYLRGPGLSLLGWIGGFKQLSPYTSPHVEEVKWERLVCHVNTDKKRNLNNIPNILFNHVF